MGDLVEGTGGSCPRCGHLIERLNEDAALQLGETKYLCPQCGWTFETGLDFEAGGVI